jgi:hypothetical protein
MPDAGSASPLRLSRSLALDSRANAIEVVAYNNANLIASLPARQCRGGSSCQAVDIRQRFSSRLLTRSIEAELEF